MSEKKLKKVIFLGDPSVGKTTLIQSYINKKFTPSTASTIGKDSISDPFGGFIYYDTAGQDRYFNNDNDNDSSNIDIDFAVVAYNPPIDEKLDFWLTKLNDFTNLRFTWIVCIDKDMCSNAQNEKNKIAKLELDTKNLNHFYIGNNKDNSENNKIEELFKDIKHKTDKTPKKFCVIF